MEASAAVIHDVDEAGFASQVVERSKQLIDELTRGPEYREGVAALREKRAPRF